MIKLKHLLAIYALFSVVSAYHLDIAPSWEKHKQDFQLVQRGTGNVCGEVECWILYDHVERTKEGCIGSIEIDPAYQGQGFGRYLFSRAIKYIDLYLVGNVRKTRWYACPPDKKFSDITFKPLLGRLVSFYERLGGCQEMCQPHVGVYFSFDHTDRNLVAARSCDAETSPEGYKVCEVKKSKHSVHAARVYDVVSKTRLVDLCEIQYEKWGRSKSITGMQLLAKDLSWALVTRIIHLLAEKLSVSRDEIEDALVVNLSEDYRKLPTLYDNVFFCLE